MRQLVKDHLIRYHDRKAPLAGSVRSAGGCWQTTINQPHFLELAQRISQKIHAQRELVAFLQETQLGNSIDFTDALVFAPPLATLITNEIADSVAGYLGRRAVMDSCILSVMDTRALSMKVKDAGSKPENNSSLYHHDSVGHRLKLFIPLNEDGNRSFPTEYIENSNLIKWRTYLNDEKGGERLDLSLFDEDCGTKKRCCVSLGEAYLFDTNGIHRGLYNDADQLRIILQFEFSDKRKKIPGKTGPQSFTITREGAEHLKRLGLIDASRLVARDNNLLHMGKATRRHEQYIGRWFEQNR